MRTLSRFGITAAAALALTPAARPCDPTAYDPKDDSPHLQVCDREEAPRAAPAPEAKRGDVRVERASLASDDAARAGSGSGTGSGAPVNGQVETSSPYDDAPRSW